MGVVQSKLILCHMGTWHLCKTAGVQEMRFSIQSKILEKGWGKRIEKTTTSKEAPIDEDSRQLPPPRPLAREGGQVIRTLVPYPPNAPPEIGKRFNHSEVMGMEYL